MKKCLIIVALVLVLAGCSTPTLENVGDVYAPDAQLQMRNLTFDLPEDADTQVLESDSGKLYFCDGYEISVQTFSSGDLNDTLLQISGYDRSRVTVFQTKEGTAERYDCVWVSAGDGGDEVHRAVILDDGRYHYCLCVTAAAMEAGSLQDSWSSLFSSVGLAG